MEQQSQRSLPSPLPSEIDRDEAMTARRQEEQVTEDVGNEKQKDTSTHENSGEDADDNEDDSDMEADELERVSLVHLKSTVMCAEPCMPP
jgi:hypothetical protein